MGPHLLYRVQKRGKEVQTVKVYGKRFVSICIDFEWAGPGTFIRTLQQCRSWDLFVETVVVEANQLDLGGRWTKNQEKKRVHRSKKSWNLQSKRWWFFQPSLSRLKWCRFNGLPKKKIEMEDFCWPGVSWLTTLWSVTSTQGAWTCWVSSSASLPHEGTLDNSVISSLRRFEDFATWTHQICKSTIDKNRG